MRSTGENLFSLVYRAEAVLPTELKDGSPRISTYDNHKYAEERFDDVDFLEEICSRAIVRSAHYLQGLRRYHGWHVRSRELHPGDLVLRRKQHSSDHKLSPKWEKPYRVTHVFRPGCVSLQNKDGILSRTRRTSSISENSILELPTLEVSHVTANYENANVE
jgi:hypothetical protein